MNASRVAAWIFFAAVAGAWLASAAGVSRPNRQPRIPPRPSDARALDNLAADVQAQSARLRQKLESAPAPKAPSRNPFTFSERPAAPVQQVRRMPEPVYTPEPPPVAPQPALELIGIAEKKVGDGHVRTAMLTAGDAGNLVMATVGQTILGAYEVVAIGADAVELKDVASGDVRRLVLR